jgi:hypothetical protein
MTRARTDGCSDAPLNAFRSIWAPSVTNTRAGSANSFLAKRDDNA